MAKSKINAEIALKASGTGKIVADVNKVTDSVKKSANVVGDLKNALTSTRNPFKQFGNVLSVADRQIESFEKYVARANLKILAVRESAKKISQAAIGGFGMIAGGTALAVKGVINLADGVASKFDTIAKFSRNVGISAVQLQKWHYAAERSGMSTDQFNNSIRKFSSNVSKAVGGEKKQLELFNALGISLRKTNGQVKGNNELMLELAKAYDKIGNAQDKVRITEELFGRGAVGINNLFEGGSASLQALLDRREKLGMMFTEDDARNAEEFKDVLLDVNTIIEGIKNKFVADMLPSLNQGLNEFIDVWDKNGNKILDKTKIAADVVGQSFIELVKLAGDWCNVLDQSNLIFTMTGEDFKFVINEMFEEFKGLVRWWQDVPLIGDIIKFGKDILTSGNKTAEVAPKQVSNPVATTTASNYTETRNTTNTSKVLIDVKGSNNANYGVDVDEAFAKDKNVDLNMGWTFSY